MRVPSCKSLLVAVEAVRPQTRVYRNVGDWRQQARMVFA